MKLFGINEKSLLNKEESLLNEIERAERIGKSAIKQAMIKNRFKRIVDDMVFILLRVIVLSPTCQH